MKGGGVANCAATLDFFVEAKARGGGGKRGAALWEALATAASYLYSRLRKQNGTRPKVELPGDCCFYCLSVLQYSATFCFIMLALFTAKLMVSPRTIYCTLPVCLDCVTRHPTRICFQFCIFFVPFFCFQPFVSALFLWGGGFVGVFLMYFHFCIVLGPPPIKLFVLFLGLLSLASSCLPSDICVSSFCLLVHQLDMRLIVPANRNLGPSGLGWPAP